jgi:hypothetical protein
MKTKLLIILSIVFSLVAVFVFFNKNQRNNTQTPNGKGLKNYTTKPLTECVVCQQGKSWNNTPCCTDNFDTECTTKNGVIRKTDLHPAFNSMLKGCFQKAPDAGKECAEGSSCLSGFCDLENAIKSTKCNLIKKELTGEKSKFYDVDFYMASYACETSKPGTCAEATQDQLNPGGVLHEFRMDNSVLVETLKSGPIR